MLLYNKRLWLTSIVLLLFGFTLYPQLSRLRQDQPSNFRAAPLEDPFVPDRTAGHVHKPNTVWEYEWSEHPVGSIRRAINNLGFVESSDTKKQKDDETYRILVTGEANIDGWVNNAESFPNRLEMMLNSNSKKPKFEVINGAIGRYGPYNYVGFLRKFLFLKPDMYVVVVYTGNNFSHGLRTAIVRNLVRAPKRPEGFRSTLRKAVSENKMAYYQALQQIHYFKTYPELRAFAVDIAVQQMIEIQRICLTEGIELVVLTLPTKCDLESDLRPSPCENASETLGLSLEDLEINKRMAQEFRAKLNEHGIEVLDLLPAMHGTEEELFWEKDYHLNQRGHDVAALSFFDQFGARVLRPHRLENRRLANGAMHSDAE